MKLLIVVSVLMSLCCDVHAQIKFVDSGQIPGTRSASSVDLGDIDNDDDLDAFVINGEWNLDQPNEIWINNGKGIFTKSAQQFQNSRAGRVSLGDLDGDGDLDAVLGYFNFIGGTPSEIWLNDGKGIFTDSGQRLGHRNGSMMLADLDGDGDLDAFNCNHVNQGNDGSYTNGGHKIWINDGKGNFTDSGQDFGDGWNTSAALGDIDGDADIDAVVSANSGSTGNTIWLNDGRGRFTRSDTQLSTKLSGQVTLGDLDGDSDLDVMILYPNEIKIMLNDGKGNFTETTQMIQESTNPAWIALGDLDKDGDLDAFVAYGGWKVRYPAKVWVNDGKGYFTDSGLRLGNDESQEVRLGDLDGDGDLDAFVANSGGNKVYFNSTGEDSSTGIGRNQALPQEFKLNQNYPNPFNPTTTIGYYLPAEGIVNVTVYDLLGRKVKTLVNTFLSAGEHSIEWNATNEDNNPIPSGVYFYLLASDDIRLQKKMILLR